MNLPWVMTRPLSGLAGKVVAGTSLALVVLGGCTGQPSSSAPATTSATSTQQPSTESASATPTAEPIGTVPIGTSDLTDMSDEATTMFESSMPGSTEIDQGLAPYVQQAVADLAGRLGIEAGGIATVSAAVVVWPTAALGCPKKGRQYAQVQSDGSLIVLRVGDVSYRYHSGDSTPPFLCG